MDAIRGCVSGQHGGDRMRFELSGGVFLPHELLIIRILVYSKELACGG